ncbi:MAG TPA: hypothetical protein VMP01_29190 [Pirellulaceae bacterium]|nr:hypothetical protein [Pirellulaceae bacterium]
MFRFTIRDLLLLTLAVAMGVGWALRERQLKSEQRERREWQARAGELQLQIDQMILASDEAGFHFSGRCGGGYLLLANDRRADSN